MAIWTATILGVLSAAAAAQAPLPAEPAPTPPSNVSGVTVTARAPTDPMRIVAAFGQPDLETGQLPRWDREVCVKATGLAAPAGAYIAERIADTARSVRLDADRPGCAPNVFVVATDDPARFWAQFVKEHGAAMGGARNPALQWLLAERHPVTWWRSVVDKPADGRAYDYTTVDGHTIKVLPHAKDTRLSLNIKTDMAQTVIVVDTKAVQGVPIGSLSAYLAMTALAPVRGTADPAGAPSVMRLFRDRAAGLEPAQDLTAWDRAYLAGLYGSARSDDARAQEILIAARVAARHEATPPPSR